MRRRLVRVAIAVVAVASAAWLWSWSGRDRGEGRGLLGGPLFDFTADQVVALEIRRTEGACRLVRQPDRSWTLTGLVADLVDTLRLAPVLAELAGGSGAPVLAGTEPDERRFGFGGERSLELVFHLRDGGRERLAFGDVTQVSDLVYARGAGRRGVCGGRGGLFATAARLPDSVREARLLPPISAAELDSLAVDRRGGAALFFAPRSDGTWWLRLPGGMEALVGKAARYHRRYADRREERDGGSWFLADVRRVRDLVFRASDTAVVEFPPAAGPDAVDPAAVGLEPPYRAVTLFAQGGGRPRVEFGEDQGGDLRRVYARRDGALVVTRLEALLPLEGPVSGFLDLDALSFRLELADSFRVEAPDRPLLAGTRAPAAAARHRVHQSVWNALVPAGWRAAFGLEATANHVSDLQIYLDRLETVEVLDPAAVDPLRTDPRWRLRAWFPGGRVHEVWLGRLAGDGRAAVWEPRDGKVLVVGDEILVTLHSLRADLVPR